MDTGLMKIDWDNISNYNDEDITYYLSLEGKSIECISRIRNLDKATVQRHLINGKIRYRFLAKSKNIEDLYVTVAKAGKQDKVSVLNSLSEEYKEKLVEFIREKYINMPLKDKESAVWILGELRDNSSFDILVKASVHKQVNIRRMAISAMGKLNDSRAEVALIRALEDSNPQVVLYAIKALQKMKSKTAYDKIYLLSKGTEKSYIQRTAEFFVNDFNI